MKSYPSNHKIFRHNAKSLKILLITVFVTLLCKKWTLFHSKNLPICTKRLFHKIRKISMVITLALILSRRLGQPHCARKHELSEYRVVGRRVIAIDIVTHHLTRDGDQRPAPKKNPVNVQILSLAIPAETESSKYQLQEFESSLFIT